MACEQLTRKWSTKSNSSETESGRTTLRELIGGERSAGNIAKRSTSSCCSRPQLACLVQQSDSAIGSSLGGSCSFLPPPPPYRPPRPSSGSDGAIAIGAHQLRKAPQGRDYTSLLGFDLLGVREEQQQPKREEHQQDCSQQRQRDEKTLTKRAGVPAGGGGGGTPRPRPKDGGRGSGRHGSPSLSPSAMSFSEFPEIQEKVQRLQVSRDSLSLQVAFLSQQVALQREKIRDLEGMLSQRNSKHSTEGMNRQLAELRSKYTALEQDKREAERRLRQSNSELERFSHSTSQQSDSPEKDEEVGKEELERLQMAVQRLSSLNEQKDSLIHSLRTALETQQRKLSNGGVEGAFCPQPVDISEQIRRILLDDRDNCFEGGQPMAHSCSFPAGLSSGRPPSAGTPPSAGQHQQPPFPCSSSFHSALGSQQAMMPPPPLWRVSSPPALLPAHLGQSPSRTPASPLARQLAAELDEIRRSGTVGSVTSLQRPYASASLPRPVHTNSLGPIGSHKNSTVSQQHFESDDEALARPPANPASQNGQSAGGKQFKRGRRARSTLRSFLGRLAHRGNSLQDLRPSPARPPPTPFSGPICLRPPVRDFVDWGQSKCARWLTELGFSDCALGSVRSGRHLLNMTDGEFERELGIRSGVQRKRLRSLLDRVERGTEFESADRLDTNQTMLWLDLVGLPQLRDLFAECRMDGHLLLILSAQDLIELGLHSALNHASLSRAIQFLRSADFHLHRLDRHFQSEMLSRTPLPQEVERWSHGCVAEWLRTVDLAEFTPNLAFSGLHGALMVLEPTFTAESLAELLQIPPQKTLLRRHLASQFNAILGQQVVAHKRDVLAQPFVTHLVPSLRIKLARKGFSLVKMKSKTDIWVDPEVRVCPAEGNGGCGGGEEMSDV